MKKPRSFLFFIAMALLFTYTGCTSLTGRPGTAPEEKAPSAEIWAEQGVALVQEMRYEEGIAAFTRALAMNPEDAETFYNRGYAWRMTGNLERALEDFRAAQKLRPEDRKIRAAVDVVENELHWDRADQPYFRRQRQQSPGE